MVPPVMVTGLPTIEPLVWVNVPAASVMAPVTVSVPALVNESEPVLTE